MPCRRSGGSLLDRAPRVAYRYLPSLRYDPMRRVHQQPPPGSAPAQSGRVARRVRQVVGRPRCWPARHAPVGAPMTVQQVATMLNGKSTARTAPPLAGE